MVCDCCLEEHEGEFFCSICCDSPELEEVEVPDPQWSYDPRDPETKVVEEYRYYSVCINCCPGH